MRNSITSNGTKEQASRTLSGRMEAAEELAGKRGYMVLTPEQMRSRFSDSASEQILGLVEGLRGLEKGGSDYQQKVQRILKLSRRD